MAEGFFPPAGGIGWTSIGEICLSDTPIDMESREVAVFEGFHNGMPVVVKRSRMDQLPLICIPELIHPNIVRYWAAEHDKYFVYYALERCTCSLYDLIRALSPHSDSSDLCVWHDDSPSMVRYESRLRHLRDTMQDVSLWTDGGRPSPLLLKLMREVVSGLGHLHDLGLLHRDLKPQNISITGKPLVAKLSNLGSDLNDGTPGWQERGVHHLPSIPAIDMFCFGCVLFFCVTGGKHPFGKNPYFNIMNNNMDLSSVAFIPEAHDLISRLLNPDPKLRPKASEVLQHPFLSNLETKRSFFSDAKDWAVKIPHSMDAPAKDRAVKIPHSTDTPKPEEGDQDRKIQGLCVTSKAPDILGQLDVSAEGFLPPDGGIGWTRIGKILLSDTPIDMESGGITEFEGFYNDSIPVVVKRSRLDLLPLAYWIPELIHPNIVRYWAAESVNGFVYYAVERCTCSLYDLIRALSPHSDSSDSCVWHDNSPSMVRYKSRLRYLRDTMQDVSLWTDGGRPSPLLLKLMREVVSGLGYLHDLGLIHRDLTPQNITITGKPLVAKLSNLATEISDGTPGWQERDIFRLRPIPAIDMFAFGCVLFFCITGGKHPFGKNPCFNIMNNNMDLSSVASIPEAHDLIARLLNPDHTLRPKVSEVLQHPFLSNLETRRSFFSDAKDWAVKIPHSMDAPAKVFSLFASKASKVLRHPFLSNSETRRFFFSDAKDRVVKIPHSTDTPKPEKEMGRFPAPLMEVVSRFCKKEVVFRKYLKYFK